MIRSAGSPDLRAGRVRFVGDPATRIAEDVLRILRYYRFEARFGSGDGDPAARAACRAAAHHLPRLSVERIAQELVKLLETSDPVRGFSMMQQDGVLAVILPEARRLDRLQQMIVVEPEPDPLRRLAALLDVAEAGADAVAARLRLSNAWRDRLRGLAAPWPIDPQGDDRAQRGPSIGWAPSATAISFCCRPPRVMWRASGWPRLSVLRATGRRRFSRSAERT